MSHPPRSCDSLDDDHMTAEVHRRWGGGSSYPWSWFMAGCPILISMASLIFLFTQTSSLAITLTLSSVIFWCSCAQCSPTAVSEFLRLRWSFILVASVLPVSPMYVRGHSGHSTIFLSVRCFVLRMYQDGSNGVGGPMVSAHPMCFEHMCECLEGALHVRQANISLRPGPSQCSALLLLGSRDLEHPLFVPIGLQGVLDVGHLLPSTIRAGDHDFCSPHDCRYH